MTDRSRILEQIPSGEPHASEQLLPLVYEELRELAAQKLSHEAPGQPLQATDLVHEVYLRLVLPTGGSRGPRVPPYWHGRRHFLAAAAQAMRRILINRARDRRRLKRGGGWRQLQLEDVDLSRAEPAEELLLLRDALVKLAVEEPVWAELVQLRFFSGLTLDEAADVLGVVRRTADRYWALARSRLHAALSNDEDAVAVISEKVRWPVVLPVPTGH
jgi:RNA polymerase sigma factor (TIGR02999 family)